MISSYTKAKSECRALCIVERRTMMSSTDENVKKTGTGLSLLQGLAILAALGLIGAAIARYFAG